MKRMVTRGAAALVLAAGLTGCGGDEKKDSGPSANGVADMKPAEALREADQAMARLTDVSYSGFMTGGDADRLKASAAYVLGDACELHLSGRDFGVMTVVGIERTQYVERDGKNWRVVGGLGMTESKLWEGNWMSLPLKGDELDACHGEELVPDDAARRTFRAGKETEVAGHPVRVFTGEDARGRDLTLWIATTGEPLVVQAAGRDGDGPWKFTLIDTDSGVKVVAPPEKVTLDIEDL